MRAEISDKEVMKRLLITFLFALFTLMAIVLIEGCGFEPTQGIKCIDGKAWYRSDVNPEVYYPSDKTCMVIK